MPVLKHWTTSEVREKLRKIGLARSVTYIKRIAEEQGLHHETVPHTDIRLWPLASVKNLIDAIRSKSGR